MRVSEGDEDASVVVDMVQGAGDVGRFDFSERGSQFWVDQYTADVETIDLRSPIHHRR